MGKRKQKIKWSFVAALQWSQDNKSSTPPVESNDTEVSGRTSRRSSAQGWTSSLAPRFERKAAAAAEQKQIYYEGEFCEAENLPNGFTKIRSKNLDILFKQDYYEQKRAAQKLREEQGKSLEHLSSERALEEEVEEMGDDQTNKESFDTLAEPVTIVESKSWSFDQINLSDIKEFQPMRSCGADHLHSAPPYLYSSYQACHEPEAYKPPNLYIYSPTENSLIPCEEIMVPNPVMSADGPVYSGPTNIYLAYPVQGPDGRGYITQPFTPPGSYMSQGSASYSPSMSYDGTNCYSSTPHTYSGQDSGSTTQPASPPPIASYHPAQWVDQDMVSMNPHPKDFENKSTDKQCQPQPVLPSKAAPLTYSCIPGLSQDRMMDKQKKSIKRRKKKMKKVDAPLDNGVSASSDSDNQNVDASGNNDVSETSEQNIDMLAPEVVAEPVREIWLTDDLADSLVNPPTDPESSNEFFSSSLLNSFNHDGLAVNLSANSISMKVMQLDETAKVNEKVCDISENMKVIVQDPIPTMADICSDPSETKVAPELEKKDKSDNEMKGNCLKGDTTDNKTFKSYNDTVVDMNYKITIKVPEVKPVKNIKRKLKNRKRKQDLVLMPKPIPQSSSSQAQDKESYSSVIKSNFVSESPNPPTSSTRIVPLPTNPPPSHSPGTSSAAHPATSQGTWLTLTKNRKQRNRMIETKDSLVEEIPELRTVTLPETCTVVEEIPEMVEEANEVVEKLSDDINNDDIEVQRKKSKKKKKFKSIDLGVEDGSHRVIICDDQVEIRYTQTVTWLSEELGPSSKDTVNISGYSDFLVIRELGSGISRGCMNYGRLYQGKYIPPERTDGIPLMSEEMESCNDENVTGDEAIIDLD